MSSLLRPIRSRAGFAGIVGALWVSVHQADAASKLVSFLADQPNATSAYTPGAAHSFATGGSGISVKPYPVGNYEIFAEPFAVTSSNGVIRAYNSANYCIASPFGAVALVSCFDSRGIPANTEFAVLFQYRTGAAGNSDHAIAFLEADGFQGAVVGGSLYNSLGGKNTLTRNGPGLYTATFGSLTNSGGQLQITPYLYTFFGYAAPPTRCTAQGWSAGATGTTASIACVDKNGAPIDTEVYAAYSYGDVRSNRANSLRHTLPAGWKPAACPAAGRKPGLCHSQ